MSFLERFRTHTDAVPAVDTAQHEAVVELLALAAYVDNAVNDAELEELAAFDASHTDWDSEGFSALQHLPLALAKARTASLEEIAGRITSPELRMVALSAVEGLLMSDGVSAGESDFLREVRGALG